LPLVLFFLIVEESDRILHPSVSIYSCKPTTKELIHEKEEEKKASCHPVLVTEFEKKIENFSERKIPTKDG
jgi:hypothetical protein